MSGIKYIIVGDLNENEWRRLFFSSKIWRRGRVVRSSSDSSYFYMIIIMIMIMMILIMNERRESFFFFFFKWFRVNLFLFFVVGIFKSVPLSYRTPR